MDSADLFASILGFGHPLFSLEEELDVCYMSVDGDEIMIFTKEKEGRWIFFTDDDAGLFKKHLGQGLFLVVMMPSLGRKKYYWTHADKSYGKFDFLKKSVKDWVQDIGHYVRAKAPIKKLEDGTIIIEEIKGFKGVLPGSVFNFFLPVYAHSFPPGFHPYSADAEKFSFFWEMSQGEVLINIADKNAPIIFGKLEKGVYPEQILAMLFPSKFFYWNILD